MPARLQSIANWIRRSLHSPALAWWAARRNGLHPRLLHNIQQEISDNHRFHDRARHVWNLIIESCRDPRNRQAFDGIEWFDLERRIAAEGWTSGVLRDFRRASRPLVTIERPYGIGGCKPPDADWDDIQVAKDIGRFEITFLGQYFNAAKIPDAALPQVFKILEDQLHFASGLLTDVGAIPLRTPTCYPGREVDGETRHWGAGKALEPFVQLFKRITKLQPELARAHAVTWPATDRAYFRKLKLYALSLDRLFSADDAADTLLSIDRDAFWDDYLARELLFLLVDRWDEFSLGRKIQLTERILDGPDGGEGWTDERFPLMRVLLAARYGRYLQIKDCDFTAEHISRLAGMITSIPDWKDGYAESAVTESGTFGGWIKIDESPDVLKEIPLNEVVAKVRTLRQPDFRSLTKLRPFTGLVKEYPARALASLTAAGKRGEYPTELWSAIIENFPDEASPRLTRVFMHRIGRLPNDVIAELGFPPRTLAGREACFCDSGRRGFSLVDV